MSKDRTATHPEYSSDLLAYRTRQQTDEENTSTRRVYSAKEMNVNTASPATRPRSLRLAMVHVLAQIENKKNQNLGLAVAQLRHTCRSECH